MVASNLVLFLVFFLPFVIFPFGISFFEAPKVIVAEAGIEILLLWRLTRRFPTTQGLSRLLSRINPLAFILVSLTILFTLLSVVLFPDTKILFGNVFRLQGIFLLWHLLIFSLISTDISLDQEPRWCYLVFTTALLVVTVATYILKVTKDGRAIATLGEPNSLAATAIFFLPFILFKEKMPAKITGFIFTLVIILLSGSRSGLLALIIMSGFILLSEKRFLGVAKASIMGIMMVCFSLILPFVEGGGWFENRAEIWQTAFFAGSQAPLLGNGFGNIQSSLLKGSQFLHNNIQYQIVDSSHNIFLDWWVQGGIWGIGFLIFLTGLSLFKLAASSNRIILAGLLGLLVVLSFNPLSVSVLLMFWWSLGQGFTIQNNTKS